MKNFKSLIAFRHNIPELVDAVEQKKIPALHALQSVLANWPIQDPAASQWARVGFLANPAGDMYYANEVGLILYVSIRERILPGPVLRAEVAKRAAKLAERQGRACHRKELAQLREDAEAYLLPRSHIKETLVPVILRQKWIFVCTSSAKRADEVVLLLMRSLGTNAINRVQTVGNVNHWMNEIVTGIGADVATDTFWAGEAITIEGEDADKGTISFKGEDVTSDRVTTLIDSQGYNAVKLRVHTDTLAFTVNSSLIISGIKFKDIIMDQLRELPDEADPEARGRAEFDSTLAIVAQEFHELMKTLVTSLGGIQEVPVIEGDDDKDSTGEPDAAEEQAEPAAEHADVPAAPNGADRFIVYWLDEETGETCYTRSDQPNPGGEFREVGEGDYELNDGGPVSETDLAWLRGEDEPGTAEDDDDEL